MQAEILLTLKLQQRLFADPRRISLLKQIAQTGSISQGAKNAGISNSTTIWFSVVGTLVSLASLIVTISR